MKKITKEELKLVVKSILLEPTDEVLDQIINEWGIIQQHLMNLKCLDTQNVKPLTHINELPIIDYLREDEFDSTGSITKNQVLSNAKESDADFIITNKVVN
ncbi:Asp-tRNA(Asn)/Glu-tRNA(Gln) amidotransferase subunit GatC [Mycoplasmopsis opalescens]|uniref:Asp-tRNA(Asn)/Glu-tRNA(Gln) amidotransferase subunit GatC n=1 Tax=Mycoplasmopsis opalescens TaxID=114886 RepID=UPI0004A738F2|nr:Asp-tRNA(Asn)/Glu-tRNA(Gln) amidotransferase subunit GatC [Mycoplasmopsis opalescens]